MNQQNNYQFIQVPINLFYLMDANCSKVFTTLIQMDSFYPKEEGYFECAYKTLELACGLSQNIIKACLGGLFLEGIVDVVSVGKGRGKHTNRYKVCVEKFKDYEKTPVGIAIMTEDKPIHQLNYKGTRFHLPWDVYKSEYELAQETAQYIAQSTAQKVTTNINNIDNIKNIENNILYNNIEEDKCEKVSTIEEKTKPIDYYFEMFCNYNYYFDFNMLIYEQDRFYLQYQYSIDKLIDNICKGTGETICRETILNYLGEYVRETGRLH